MTMPIGAVPAVPSLSSVTPATSASAPTAASGADFAGALGKGLDAVSNAQSTADNLAIQAATGQSIDPATYTVAATQAQLMTQLASTIQSKAVTAFNTIMGMQA